MQIILCCHVQIRYGGYAWDEVMMPKQAKKNKQQETIETVSASPFINDTVFHAYIPLTHRHFM